MASNQPSAFRPPSTIQDSHSAGKSEGAAPARQTPIFVRMKDGSSCVRHTQRAEADRQTVHSAVDRAGGVCCAKVLEGC